MRVSWVDALIMISVFKTRSSFLSGYNFLLLITGITDAKHVPVETRPVTM